MAASRTGRRGGGGTRTRTGSRPARGQSRRRTTRRKHVVIGVLVLIVAAAYYMVHSLILPNIDQRWETCTVTNMTATSIRNSGTDYRIYTSQCDVLQDTDNWLHGKTNSASIYGQIRVGGTYRFHVVGVRWSATSNFPNILAVAPAAK